jgi:rod shape-determining protein MreC
MRTLMADLLTPIWGALQEPVQASRQFVNDVQHLASLRSENARMREENERLWRWHSTALALEAENQLLRRQLDFVPEAAPAYRTARVVADAGGVYAKAVLIAVGPNNGFRKGQVALDERGLVGRITEVGSRSARVLLANDMNSRIPVTLEGSRARALMVGTNNDRPRLQHWPEGITPTEGERVVTSAEANAFPAGLPVGVVRFTASGTAEIELFAHLGRLDIVRLFDYGMGGILPPEAVARPEPRPQRR